MMPAWFESELVTRGTEIDTTATVGMPVFLRYFELLRWQLMVEPSLALRALIDAGHFFVVRSQTVELRQRIGQHVRLRVSTRIGDVGRSTVQVLHEARDAHGVVARARVLGVWLGPDRRMARLPDTFRAAAAAQRAHHEVAAADADTDLGRTSAPAEPARISAVRGGHATSFIDPPRVEFAPMSLAVDAPLGPPSSSAFEHTIIVPPRDLDVFSHVNAATWHAYADDARHFAAAAGVLTPEVARGFVVRAAIFYGREAPCHDVLRVVLAPLEDPFADRRALGAWFFRAGEAEPLCTLRLDLAPGARAVTAPGADAPAARDGAAGPDPGR